MLLAKNNYEENLIVQLRDNEHKHEFFSPFKKEEKNIIFLLRTKWFRV